MSLHNWGSGFTAYKVSTCLVVERSGNFLCVIKFVASATWKINKLAKTGEEFNVLL